MNRKDILPRLFRFIKIRETGKRYLFPDVFSNIHLQEDCSNSAVLYYDLNWFQTISDAKAFFVTRIKNNAQIEFLGQHREPNKKLVHRWFVTETGSCCLFGRKVEIKKESEVWTSDSVGFLNGGR